MNYEEGKKKPAVMDLHTIFREHGLPYLPAKSLHRFKSVSSVWNFWISRHFFSHRQSYSFRTLSGFFYQDVNSETPRFLSFDRSAYGVPDPSFRFLPEPISLKQSCNGLVCCWSPNSCTYYVCNPVTQQWRALPKSPRNHGKDPDVVLKFEPENFNFDSDFDLICTFMSSNDEREFDIFSSKTNTWNLSKELVMYDTRIVYGCHQLESMLLPNSGIYAKNVAYWKMRYQSNLLALDLVKERASLVYLPYSGQIGQLHGRLYHASLYDTYLTLSVLSSPSGGWSLAAKLLLDNLVPSIRRGKREVLAVHGSDVIIHVDARLFLYSTATRSITEVREVVGDLFHESTLRFPYINSLVSVGN
ncbi:F-box protein At5g49610-like [Aristolochia californica]|uniref:F-box protein At5g49610-like n=1 Tax=Aristolochia californica TaxID=171875 RepID=UPI0035DBA016